MKRLGRKIEGLSSSIIKNRPQAFFNYLFTRLMKKTFFRYSSFALTLILSLSSIANEGLNTDLAILKINKEVKALNNEILSLKDEIEILRENQRLNSEEITELLQMIESVSYTHLTLPTKA